MPFTGPGSPLRGISLAGVGFAARWGQLVENPFHVNRAEARLVEATAINVVLIDDIDRTVLRRLLRGGNAREVVGPVAAVGSREVYVGRPDDVGVADVPVVVEGIDEGKILAPLLDQHHIPQVAPVVQDGRVRLNVLSYIFQGFAPPVILAHVVSRVGRPDAR